MCCTRSVTPARAPMLLFCVQEYERALKYIFPACSKVAGRHISQTLTILDLQGLSGLGLSAAAQLGAGPGRVPLACLLAVHGSRWRESNALRSAHCVFCHVHARRRGAAAPDGRREAHPVAHHARGPGQLPRDAGQDAYHQCALHLQDDLVPGQAHAGRAHAGQDRGARRAGERARERGGAGTGREPGAAGSVPGASCCLPARAACCAAPRGAAP